MGRLNLHVFYTKRKEKRKKKNATDAEFSCICLWGISQGNLVIIHTDNFLGNDTP